MRSSRGGTTLTSVKAYSGFYLIDADRNIIVDIKHTLGSGILTPGPAWLEDNHFGIFHPQFSNAQGFMSIPGFMKIKVHNKLLSKIDDNKIPLGHIAAEMVETVSYVSSHVRTLVDFGTAVVGGRYKRALSTLGISKKRWYKFHRRKIFPATGSVTAQAAARYLEFSFAIVPTLKDLRKIFNLYDSPQSVLKKVRLKSTARVHVDDRYEDNDPPSGSKNLRTTRVKSLSGFLSASCTYSVRDPEVIAAKALGINNVPASAYQAVPFSWLVDYVVNVGEFLELITATEGLTFRHGYTSLQAQTSAKIKRSSEAYGTFYGKTTWSTELTESWGFQRGYTRELMSSFPRPMLRFVLPELSLRKASYVAALGISFKRKAISAGMY